MPDRPQRARLDRRARRAAAAAGAALALATGLLAACAPRDASTPPATASTGPSDSTPSAAAPAAPTPSPTPTFDRTLHLIDDPASIWVVVNKRRPLAPADAAPADLSMPAGVPNEFAQPLREPAARAVEALYAAASAEGVPMQIISAYRPYSTQVALYDSYVQRDGQAAADTYSARPGHSEHQTGLAVDFDDGAGCYLAACFAGTPAGVWLAEHAWEYGFVLRYPDGGEGVTGFISEPWHYRYVGPELAAELHATGVRTLEEFFGLPAAPDYG